jgi:hypothetical protein
MPTRFLILLVALTGAVAHAADEGEAAALTRAIEAARDDAGVPFGLQVDCTGDKGVRSLSVYRGRVGVFNRDRQIVLETDQRRDLLERLLETGFAGFADSYGGRRKPDKAEAPLKVVCRVVLDIDGRRKSSVQVLQGEHSAALKALAEGILDVAETLAAEGTGASSLEDGLAKLAGGALAPEVLTLRLVSLPPSSPEAEGYILRVEAGGISRQAYAPGRLVGAATPQPLAVCQEREIVAALRRARVWALPVNLRGEEAVELEVAVLGQRKSIFVRSGVAPAGEAQQGAFADLIEALAAQPSGCAGDG